MSLHTAKLLRGVVKAVVYGAVGAVLVGILQQIMVQLGSVGIPIPGLDDPREVADVPVRHAPGPVRAGGDLMYHVHDVMHAIHDASREGRHVELQSRVERPAPFSPGLAVDIFA